MIIYLEGPDGSGKTTLLDKIWTELSDKYLVNPIAESYISTNPNKPLRIDKENLFDKLIEFAKDQTWVHILDRGPISDIIYRLFDEHDSVMTLNEFNNLLNTYSKNILIIYCNSPDSEKNMLLRGDDNKVAIKNHKIISKTYDMIFDFLGANYPYSIDYYNYSKIGDESRILEKVKYFAFMNGGRNE